MTPDISVVIVTYNSKAVLPACIESVRAQSSGLSCDITVVDNASNDGTPQVVEQAWPDVRLLRNETNRGLSVAINAGVAAASGDYLAILNPDVRLIDDVLGTLRRYLAAHPIAGIVAPRLLNDDGSLQLSCRRFPDYQTALFNRYSLLTRISPGNRYSSRYLMSDFDHASVRDVDWVSGAVLMIPRSVFEAVGGWDAGYFMFNEDVDLCHRVRDAGYRVVYVPTASAYHSIGVSESTSAHMVIERHRSMWRYYRKHLRGSAARDAATAVGIAGRCACLLAANAVRNAGGRSRGKLS